MLDLREYRMRSPSVASRSRTRGWRTATGPMPVMISPALTELLERLQTEHPGVYPEGRLRTLQRRLKGWRREAAHRMVFGTVPVDRSLSGCGEERANGGVSGQESPVDLPLRLDDANASPTTPQGPQQQANCIE